MPKGTDKPRRAANAASATVAHVDKNKLLLIGVGGTGAKVLEAFVILAAGGFFGDRLKGKTVYLRLMDIDSAGGNKTRLEKLLHDYDYAKTRLASDAEENVKTGLLGKIRKSRPISPWDTVNIDWGNKTNFSWAVQVQAAAATFNALTVGETDKRLLRALYSEDDFQTDLRQGVRGIPRIGSLLWDVEYDSQRNANAGFWHALRADKNLDLATSLGNNPDDVGIMIVGSIFGGTGASGSPMIVKNLFEEFLKNKNANKFPIALTLMLPYFTFPSENLKTKNQAENALGKPGRFADPIEFVPNSKMALKSYKDSGLLDILSTLYLVGSDMKSMQPIDDNDNLHVDTGGPDTVNPSFPPEVVGALAAFDFFAGTRKDQSGNPVKIPCHNIGIAKGRGENDVFASLPYGSEVRIALRRLATFSAYFELLQNHVVSGNFFKLACKDNIEITDIGALKRQNWEEEFGVLGGDNSGDNRGSLLGFCNRALDWFAELEKNGSGTFLEKTISQLRIDAAEWDFDNSSFNVFADVDFAELSHSLNHPYSPKVETQQISRDDVYSSICGDISKYIRQNVNQPSAK
jgi:hypothetical protein